MKLFLFSFWLADQTRT